jgi:hypothetical protein
MFRKAKIIAAASAALLALTAAPANAHFYVIYYSDYPGGTMVGWEHYCDNYYLLDSWGSTAGDPFYLLYTGETPC